jgi:hypothetical protein
MWRAASCRYSTYIRPKIGQLDVLAAGLHAIQEDSPAIEGQGVGLNPCSIVLLLILFCTLFCFLVNIYLLKGHAARCGTG